VRRVRAGVRGRRFRLDLGLVWYLAVQLVAVAPDGDEEDIHY
jgi:hypothetical protein